jgi:hypothetical protein
MSRLIRFPIEPLLFFVLTAIISSFGQSCAPELPSHMYSSFVPSQLRRSASEG